MRLTASMQRNYAFILLIVLGPLGVLFGADAAEPERPNIIVIFTDDHGYADLSSQGIFDDLKTPHIDSLAVGGVRMTSGYVTAPQCVPSRGGLLTGRYQNRFGLESNGEPLDGFNAQRTMAQRLKQAGYATGMTGKWHLGPPPEIPRHGFDDVFYKHSDRPGWANYDLDGNDVPPGPEQSGLYHIDANSAAARAFIKRHHDRPFFFYLAYRAPHVPLDATEKYLKRFPDPMPERRRQALAMLSAIDDGVGGVLHSLREYGIEERTLIFFIGDNGAPLKIHKLDAPGGGPGWDGSLNDPMNGEKGMLSEGGIRVPFVVYWKGQVPAGQVCDHPVISLDVAATAMALAGNRIRKNSGDSANDPKSHDSGYEENEHEELDGVNLIPYLRDEKDGAPHDALYWRWIAQSAVREGRWKYLRGGTREYLFDLAEDKEEKHNLLKTHPEIAERLRSKLAQWATEMDPPGLETKQMSEVWERYFDYYLEGKPAPPLPARRGVGRRTDPPSIKGWIPRNGSAKLSGGMLQIRPKVGPTANKQHPFIAAARLSLTPPLTAVVRLRTERAGAAGFAWREEGQPDFPPKQAVTFNCPASTEWQDHEVDLPAQGKVIHVRLLLPTAGADIERVEFQDVERKPLKTWQFAN